MSAISQNKLDRQWSEEVKKVCLDSCSDYEIRKCIGQCQEVRSKIIEGFNEKIKPLVDSTEKEVKKESKGIVLEVNEHKDGQTTSISKFDLKREDNETFLPQWRSIGEMYLGELGDE